LISILNELFLPIAPAMELYQVGELVKFEVSNITPENVPVFKTIQGIRAGKVEFLENAIEILNGE